MYGWLLYFLVVLVASAAVGRHLGRFREACTEMTGMMAGMTIGMLGGFALGYGMTAAAGRDLFLGNLTGVLLGAALGGWFGRTGGLMGIMDGSMGGVMGGSMGAMIAAMVFPNWALNWTGVLFGGIYVVGCGALIALIESRAPEHEALHWLLPKLARIQPGPRRVPVKGKTAPSKKAVVAASSPTRTVTAKVPAPVAAPIRDYYALFGVPRDAGLERIEEAYLDLLAKADTETLKRADRALATLSAPERRALYDAALQESLKRQPQAAAEGRGDCCPPPKKKAATQGPAVEATSTTAAVVSPAATPRQTTSVPSRPLTAGQPPATKVAAKAKTPSSPAPRVPAPLPALAKNARQAQAPSSTKSTANAHAQGGKHKQAQQSQAGAGKRNSQPVSIQERRDSRYDRSYRGGRGRAYQEPGLDLGKRIAVGMVAALAIAFVLMLVVYVSSLNTGSASAAGYLNQSPPGAAYHVGNPVPSEAQLESQAVAATVGTDGVQTADLVLDQATSSYKPAAIKVKKGAPVRLNVSVEGSSRDCRSVVRLPALGAQALTQPGQAVPMNFTPSQAGVYEFNCPMQMMNPSYLVVTN